MSLEEFSLKEVTARPLRVIFTFLSIAIGVGAVVAVLLATNTTRRAQAEMLKTISGNADLEVVPNGDSFAYDLVIQARGFPGVRQAVPSYSRLAVLFYGEERARTQVLGIDPRIDQEVRDYKVVEGRQPEAYAEILLDSSFAHSLKIKVGSQVKFLARGGQLEFSVVGLVRPSGSGAVGLSSAAYLVLNAAQALFDVRNQVNLLLLDVEDGYDVESVRQSLQAEFPEGVTVRQPRTGSNMARETMYATENGLHLAIAFALLQAAFIIYNTFQMAVGERRRQLGILRAIGATRWQVASMILREALVVSIVASIAGSFLGVWGAGWLNVATERVLQVNLPQVELSWFPFLVAVALGIGVSLLGASLPARRASTVSPIEAIRAVELAYNQEVIHYTWFAAIVVLPAGIVLFLLNLTGRLPVGSDAVAIVLMLLGCVLFIPAVLESWSAALVRALSSLCGVEIQLAQRQLIRHVGRATLTIGVLFIAMSTSAGLAGNILDNVENVRIWYQRSVAGDFFVRATMPDLATGTAADMPPEVGRELAELPGIESIEPMRFASVQSAEESILLIIRGFEPDRDPSFDLVEGTARQALDGLQNEQVVIGTVLAQRMQLLVGDKLPVETPDGTVTLPIAAVVNDYLGGGLTAYMKRDYAMRLLGIDGVDAYVIQAIPEQRDALEQELLAFTLERGLILQSYAELINLIDSMINGVIASLWMLLALGSLISAMGLVNTLTMNILEQTREIGMLRVVAMTRSQVRRMILSQAILIGVIGLIPGCLAGFFVAYAISLSSYAVLGHQIVFHFRPLLLAACLVGAAMVVVIASLLPANRAARLRLADALQYE